MKKVGLGDEMSRPKIWPYISGAVLRKDGDALVVSEVLPGTPAEEAGLESGSRVLAAFASGGEQRLSLAEGADFRANVTLVLLSGDRVTRKTFTLRGISEILAQPVPSSRLPNRMAAGLTLTDRSMK